MFIKQNIYTHSLYLGKMGIMLYFVKVRCNDYFKRRNLLSTYLISWKSFINMNLNKANLSKEGITRSLCGIQIVTYASSYKNIEAKWKNIASSLNKY